MGRKKSATLRELQSLIGSLNFACKVIPPGRAFLQRIINLTVGIKKPHHHMRLTKAFYEDIIMWKLFINNWNGKQFFLNLSRTGSSERFKTLCINFFRDKTSNLWRVECLFKTRGLPQQPLLNILYSYLL